MSTRATAHFCSDTNEPEAIIYRHSDGYPSVMGKDIKEFLLACKALPDSRLDDPTALAAKYVVWLAGQFNKRYTPNGYVKNESPLEFLSVRVMMKDSDDIEFRYVIYCAHIGKDGLPLLKCFSGDTEIDPFTDPTE